MNSNSFKCDCGNDIFITFGDSFGFTQVDCKECGKTYFLIETDIIPKKLLSPAGDDYCRVYGCLIDVPERNYKILVCDYLVFTEEVYRTGLNIENRISLIRKAKNEVVAKEWYERAARYRDEEILAVRGLERQKEFELKRTC